MLNTNVKAIDFVFSPFMQKLSHSKKVAYIGLFTAFLIVCNGFFSFPIGDVQFSLTMFASMLAGVVLGPVFGFASCFIADLIGYFISSGGMFYYFWVGISTSLFAFISGVLFVGKKPSESIWFLTLRVALIVILSFVICTVLVNSTGFYIYNKNIGALTKAIEYANNTFGSELSFLIYLAYRLIFKLQIYNSIFNYALFILVIPILKRLKFI